MSGFRLATCSLAILLAACTPTPSNNPTEVPSSPQRSAVPTNAFSPSPSAPALLDLEALPHVQLADSDTTAICDPDRSASGDVFCEDALVLGYRALRTAMPSIDRLYLSRPACASGVCIPGEVNRVRVTGWRGAEAYMVLIDWDANTITVPTPASDAAWPSATSSTAPSVRRPSLDNVPGEIRDRKPYPFCGRAQPIGFQDDQPKDVARVLKINRCFFDGVLEGRPVEMIDVSAVTGDPTIMRFAGHGRVIRYKLEGDGSNRRWVRRDGWLILGETVYWGLSGIVSPRALD